MRAPSDPIVAALDLPARADHPALAGFHAPTRAWFATTFASPTRAQELGWPSIRAGQSTLVLAPTGSGKTLAAFLAALDRMMFEPPPAREERCRVLYLSPLKSLAVDVERNLRAPLVGIARWAERLSVPVHPPAIAIRTGDTPARERAQFQRQPADIVITTPESLYLLLTSAAREALRSIRWVIVDEIHTLVGSKRGAHLALSLERLEALTGAPLLRIGLSATVEPVEAAVHFLGGCHVGSGSEPAPRLVTVADARAEKQFVVRVDLPADEFERTAAHLLPSGPAATGEVRASIWPALHPLLLAAIRDHRSTLIFVNSRRLAERLAAALNDLAGEPIARAHHGSLAREQRLHIEDDLKAGRLRALVATSSLELGIDMGAIDLVIQVEAPPSVASAIQRVGRAGHQVGTPSRGLIFPKYRGDLLACAALTERMQAAAVEPTRLIRNPLDVLSQQIVAMVAIEEWEVDALERVIRGAAPFAELPRSALEGVLDLLSGRFPSDEFAELRPLLVWDRLTGRVRARPGARRIAVQSGGAIPDRGLYAVYQIDAPPGRARVGELDEEMVHEARVGQTFVLGASTWRIERIEHDRVLVSPAPGQPGMMPFWRGDRAGRTIEFGRAIGALCRRLQGIPDEESAIRWLGEHHSLTPGAARVLLRYLADQREATGVLPDDRTIVIERFVDEMGDWRVCLLSPFGGRVHAAWAMAIEARVREGSAIDLDTMWTDDGIVIRFPASDTPPALEVLLPDPDEVESLVMRQLGGSALFAASFREAAVRSLLLPRPGPGRRMPLWWQRRRAADLLRIAARYRSFPIVLEALRECLQDRLDVPALRELLNQIRRREVRVVPVETRAPSPFAASLLFNYAANFIYEEDAPLAERRAMALTIDPARLRELLGEVDLRDLLDADVLATLEAQAQHLTRGRQARDPDGLHEILLRVGDLSRDEVAARIHPSTEAAALAEAWLCLLEQERRIVRIPIAGEERFIAAEDAARYRDALGVPPPPGLPEAFLRPVAEPLIDLVARYARTHAPFPAEAAARRFGLGVGPVLMALQTLAAAGRVVHGEFRPGGQGMEWCDAGLLRAARQRSLAISRREAEPVATAAYGRFLLAWHGVVPESRARRAGSGALVEVIAQLQGTAVPASALEREILPARLAHYDPRELDMLLASGHAIWVGREPLGAQDGRISLCLAESAPLLIDPPRQRPEGPLHDRIRDCLEQRGAVFFTQLLQACEGAFAREVLEALWDLVWAGEVTNDTLQPLRAWLGPRRSPRRTYGRGPAWSSGQVLWPLEASGRWSLVHRRWSEPPTAEERALARARQLLDRWGVVTRDVVLAEGIEGGFAALYPIFQELEGCGRIRRGYFVAGRGGIQFASPAAVDRLRGLREPAEVPQTVLLAATDPANPYGAALPWPEREEGRRPARMAHACVILVDGALAAWWPVGRGERRLLTFFEQVAHRPPEVVAKAVAAALVEEVERGRRLAVFVSEVDGRPAAESLLAPALVAAGFVLGPQGYFYRRRVLAGRTPERD